MSYGMQGYIGFGKETTWGTAVTPTAFATAMSESLSASIDRYETKNIFGGFYKPDDEAGLRRFAGDTVHSGDPSTLGYLLHAAFGAVATTSLSATFKSHVFQSATTDVSSVCALPPYTLEIFRDVTSAQQYAGCNLSKLALQFQPNQDVRATASWIGRSMLNKARIAAASVTFPNSPVSPFTFDVASVSLAGVGVDYVEALSIEIDNRLEGIGTLNGSTNINRISRNEAILGTINGTFSFDDIAQYQNFINQTEVALSVNCFRSQSFSMIITAPRLVYTAFPLSMPGRGRLTVGFTGEARMPVGSAGGIAVTLRNNVASF
jgi:hypothetical protein